MQYLRHCCDSIASFVSIVFSVLISSQWIKRHKTSSHLFLLSISFGREGSWPALIPLLHDVHALFSWTKLALEHARYRRSLHCMRMAWDSAGVFTHPSSCTLLIGSMSLHEDSLHLLHVCRLSCGWVSCQMNDTMYCYGLDDILGVNCGVGRSCLSWQTLKTDVSGGRKSRAHLSSRYDLGFFGEWCFFYMSRFAWKTCGIGEEHR